MADFPVRVKRIPDEPEGCELQAEDHRGELYRVELDCSNGMTLEVILCRHHLRTLRHTFVEV